MAYDYYSEWQRGQATTSMNMNPSSSPAVDVDSYDGILCTVAEEVPPAVYTCPYCGATFSTEAELDAHINAEHPEEVPPEEKKFPWAWVLIGGGATIAVIGLATAAKKRE